MFKAIALLLAISALGCSAAATGAFLQGFSEGLQQPHTPAGYASDAAEEGYVVVTISGCDYFIADGPRGLYVLEWYGGYVPAEGDRISGELSSYGMKDVIYNRRSSGTVWVEDYLETSSGAADEISDHCF